MKESVTVKNNYEFRRLYAKGVSAASSGLVLYYRKNKRGRNRLGVTASTKLGKAVVRNRLKRQVREIFRLSQPEMKQGFDIIAVVRSRAVGMGYFALQKQFLQICGKLDLMNKE